MSGGSAILAVDLPPEIEARLDELAALTGRSKDDYVREAVIEHLGDLQDLYLAERRLPDHRAGLSDSIPLENVMKLYGLGQR